MAITPDQFRAALGRFASGVTVVTSKDKEGRIFGMTVSAFSSVSLNPPLVLICIDKNTGTHHALTETDSFVVNILREDQQYISDRFASFLPDKFEIVKLREGIDGLPVIVDALANLECRLVHTYAGGDHTVYVGEIQHATINDGKPLLYWHGNYRKIEE